MEFWLPIHVFKVIKMNTAKGMYLQSHLLPSCIFYSANIHLFIQKIFTECLLCARHSSGLQNQANKTPGLMELTLWAVRWEANIISVFRARYKAITCQNGEQNENSPIFMLFLIKKLQKKANIKDIWLPNWKDILVIKNKTKALQKKTLKCHFCKAVSAWQSVPRTYAHFPASPSSFVECFYMRRWS